MKTNLKWISGWWMTGMIAILFGIFTTSAMCLVPARITIPKTAIVTLRQGATGEDVQRALDTLPASGGEVVLPAGTIDVRQPIVLQRDFQTLRGSGAATILRLADGANCPVIILGEPVNQPRKKTSHLRVSDLFVDGNRSHQQRELWKLSGEGSEIRNNGIIVQAVSDSSVENVTTARCRSGGVVTTLGVQRLTVRGLEAFDNEFDGLACYATTDSLFTQISLHDNPGAGISLDLAFNSNVISHAVLTGNDLGIFMRSSRNNQFHDISIVGSHHYGVFMAHVDEETPAGVRPAPQTECVQNSFTNLAASDCGSAAFRVNNITCVDNVVIGAQFAKNANGGLSLAQPNLVTLR
jgi:hypothetical protein